MSYYDLFIPKETISSEPSKLILFVNRFGYRTIAITEVIDSTIAQLNKIKSCSIDVKSYSGILQKVLNDKTEHPTPVLYQRSKPSGWDHTLTILTRIHIKVDQKSQMLISSNPALLHSYDIVSVEPTTEKFFQNACCNWSDIDIISLDCSSRLPFQLRYPTVNAAIQRGIVFELTYSASIRDVNARKQFIANAANILRVTKGKNILLSSAASSVMELRAPADVMNMGSLFSLSQNLAKEAVTSTPKAVVSHAISRKDTYRCVLSVESQSSNVIKPDEMGKRKGNNDLQEKAKKQIKLG